MDIMPNSGSFMPGEFWFALTLLFGTAFVSLLIWIINRFLVRLDVTIDWLKENVTMQGKRLDKHDKEIDEILRNLERTVKRK